MKAILFQKIISKAWEISILLVLPMIVLQGHLTVWHVGIFSALFASMQVVGGAASALVAQRYGRYFSLIFSLVLNSLSWFLLAFSNSTLLFGVTYLLAGFASGLEEATGTVTMAKMTKRGDRAGAMAMNGVMGDIGRLLASSVVVAGLATIGVQQVAIIAGIFSMVVAVFQAQALSSYDPLRATISKHIKIKFFDASLFKNKKYSYAGVAQLLDSFSSASLYLFLPLLLSEKGFSDLMAGQLSLLLFVGYAGGRVLLGKLSKKRGLGEALIIGEIVMVLSLLGLLLVTDVWVISVLLLLAGAATRGTSPVVKAMVAEGMKDEDDLDIGIAQLQIVGRILTSGNRPLLGYIAAFAGVPGVFIASSVGALLVAIPARLYEKTT